MKVVSFALEEGNKYFGTIDGQRFYIGTRVSYEGAKGLMNITGQSQLRYDRAKFREKYGFWADFIHPTATVEGGLYHTLNTYDRAHFTFSFLQFAAHVPNGDFVLYFRELLKLPQAAEYFPDLALADNRIFKITEEGLVQLESDASTAPLIDFLNPSTREIEDTEIIQAAKFVYWAQTDSDHRNIQIDVGVQNFKNKMVGYSKQYGLNNADDVVCLVIADIRHQGRAKSPEIMVALQSANPLETLLKIGEIKYRDRVRTLRREIKALVSDSSLGQYKYSDAVKDFVAR